MSSHNRFHVRRLDSEDEHGRLLIERSFEAAAIAFCESHVAMGDAGELRVMVRDLDSGREHCFRLDLETGETSECG